MLIGLFRFSHCSKDVPSSFSMTSVRLTPSLVTRNPTAAGLSGNGLRCVMLFTNTVPKK
jgi:hypothetical protein